MRIEEEAEKEAERKKREEKQLGGEVLVKFPNFPIAGSNDKKEKRKKSSG